MHFVPKRQLCNTGMYATTDDGTCPTGLFSFLMHLQVDSQAQEEAAQDTSSWESNTVGHGGGGGGGGS